MRPSGIGGGWIRLPVRRRRRMLQGAPLVGRVVRWNGTHSNKRTDPVFASARNLRTTGRGGGGGVTYPVPAVYRPAKHVRGTGRRLRFELERCNVLPAIFSGTSSRIAESPLRKIAQRNHRHTTSSCPCRISRRCRGPYGPRKHNCRKGKRSKACPPRARAETVTVTVTGAFECNWAVC